MTQGISNESLINVLRAILFAKDLPTLYRQSVDYCYNLRVVTLESLLKNPVPRRHHLLEILRLYLLLCYQLLQPCRPPPGRE